MKKLFITLTLLLVTSFLVKAQGYNVGDVVNNFTLKNANGKDVSISDYKSKKGVILMFTCNPCPYVKLYEQRILDLDKNYKGKGFPVVTINPNDEKVSPDDSFENMKKRAVEKKFTFPYLKDETQEITKAFGAKATPHVYLLQNIKGEFVVQYIGAIDNDTENTNANKSKYVEEAIESLLKNEKPKTTLTKAIGCGIKWKKA